jgi:CMP/dCMP kinase
VIPGSKALRIAISSHSGCGNTTATDNVGRTLRLDVVNYTFRDLAKDLGICFEEIQQKAGESRIFDFLTDLKLMRASLRPRVVVGSRLAGWLVNADLRVWLHAPLEARAKRIYQREPDKHTSYESVLYRTLQRDEQNRKRYLEIYGIDINDRSDFDIIINTEKLTAEQVSSLIVAAARWASQNQLDRKNLHLRRIRKIISDNLGIDRRALVDDSIVVDMKEIFSTALQDRQLLIHP